MQRVAFVMRLKIVQEEEYIRRHRKVWPTMEAEMLRAGVYKMSIFMSGQQLFLYMEVQDYAKVLRILENSGESIRSEEYMAPIMENAEEGNYDPSNPYPAGLP